jgi:hypothetical protein
MRSLVSTLAASFGIACLLASSSAFAGPSGDVLQNGTLSLPIGTLEPIVVSQSPATIAPLVSRDGGNAITGVQFNDVILQTMSFIIPVTDPGAAPIKGVQATVENDPADFGVTTMGGFGGTMPLIGFNKVCLFSTCTSAVSNIEVPVDVVGIGGTTFVSAAVNLTVIGAPWTTMTVAIGTITQMGSRGPTPTNMTGERISLVTPTFVSTNIGASAVVPVFGIFTFDIVGSPEPTTVAAIGASIAALVSVGLSRRRK